MTERKNDKNNDDHLMQIVRITINNKTYVMFAPLIVADNEELGQIDDLDFGEIVLMKHVVSCLLNCLNNTVH
jgi:hypothetical protein